jgi:hypothetical protein
LEYLTKYNGVSNHRHLNSQQKKKKIPGLVFYPRRDENLIRPKEKKANVNSGAHSLQRSLGFSSEFQQKPSLRGPTVHNDYL